MRDEIEGRVTRVIDGDTLHLSHASAPVRLWGVDAPDAEEDGFFEAGSTLRSLALHQPLRCAVVTRDRYGRLVARCFLADGRQLDRLMIESGAAQEYLTYTRGYYRTRIWIAKIRESFDRALSEEESGGQRDLAGSRETG